MAAYTTIADSEIDPESPFTTTLATKYRDNPIAITEGASGAPRIVDIAISFSSSTRILQGLVIPDFDVSTSSTFAKVGDILMPVPAGVTTFNFTALVKCPTSTAGLRVYDDVPTTSGTTSNSNQSSWTETTSTETFSVVAGTIMRLYIEFRRSSGTGDATYGGILGYFS